MADQHSTNLNHLSKLEQEQLAQSNVGDLEFKSSSSVLDILQNKGLQEIAYTDHKYDFLSVPKDAAGTSNDQAADRNIRNGILTVRYDDPNIDQELNSNNYGILRITNIPQGVILRHWIDDSGYFFWFKHGNDNKAHHHYPSGLKTIEIGAQRQDVDLERLQVSQSLMAKNDASGKGFTSLDNGTNVLSYIRSMSKASDEILKLQEKSMEEGARNSQNPYFRIYLADILITEAMRPLIQQVMNGQQVSANNPDTLTHIDNALSELKQAEQLSNSSLRQQNKYPPGNAAPLLAPLAFYQDPYAFWGGSLYQAQRREVAFTFLREIITSGALNSIQLPPIEAPR